MKCIVQAKIPLEKYDKRWYLRVTHGKQANAKPKGNRIAPFKAAEREHMMMEKIQMNGAWK